MGDGGPTLSQKTAELEAKNTAARAEQEELQANTSKIGTAATQGARGFLDAILAPGALVGMVSEGAGIAFGSEGLEDFGRGLGKASSGESAMEAAAFLFGGGGKHGLTTSERMTKASDDQQKAWPALSAISHTAGMAAPALIGGALSTGAKGAAAIGLGAAEGSAAGAQMGYERNEALRDIVSSALVGGALGGGTAALGEGLSGLLKSKAYKAAARELAEDANLSAAGISRGGLSGIAGDAAGAVDSKASELAGALKDYRFQSGPLEGKPIMRMLRTPEDIASGVQQAAQETGEALQSARTAIAEKVAANPQLAASLEQQFLQGGPGSLDKMATNALEALGEDPAAYQAMAKQAKSFEELASLVKTSASGGSDSGIGSLGGMATLGSLAKGLSAPHAMAAGLLTKVAQKAVQQRQASTIAALANTMVIDNVSSALESIIPSVEIAASAASGGKGAALMPSKEREPTKRPETLTPEKQQDRYREQLDKVNEAVTAPDVEARTELIDKVGHLPTPLVIAAGADMSAKMAQLHADMPKPTPNLRGKAYETMSSEQVRLANSMYEATTDPMSVFSDFAAGTVDYAKVKYAWKQYPGLQQAAQAGLMDILSQRLDDKARGAIPDGLLTQLDNLFGFDGKLQPTLDRGFSGRMNQLLKQPEGGQPPPKPGGSIQMPGSQPTYTERLAGQRG
jgi:hypothetical protein